MKSYLGFTIRLLEPIPSFPERAEGAEPEWPPSPLRLLQALQVAAANRWKNATYAELAKPALGWLEKLEPPIVVTPQQRHEVAIPGTRPDARAKPFANASKTLTAMRTPQVRGSADECTIHFLFPLTDLGSPYHAVLSAAARSITHLGGSASTGEARVMTASEADKLKGQRWRPVETGGTPLRVSKAGIHNDPAQALPESSFKVVGYQVIPVDSDDAAGTRSFAAFSLLTPYGNGFRPFDTARQMRDVAGMVRNAARELAKRQGWPERTIETFVCGHGSDKEGQGTIDERLMFLPLPSITPMRVESIRQVLVAGPGGASTREIQQMLNGAELYAEGKREPEAILSLLPKTERTVRAYTTTATDWSTVTPVLLSGFDDPSFFRRDLSENRTTEVQKRPVNRLQDRVYDLLKKAFVQAGFDAELVEKLQLEWREVGFRPGLELATRYARPSNLERYPAYHVRVCFAKPIRGPLTIGAGRFRGFGLFAAEVK